MEPGFSEDLVGTTEKVETLVEMVESLTSEELTETPVGVTSVTGAVVAQASV